MVMENTKDFLSILEFSQKLGKHPNTIRRAIKNGRISACRIGASQRSSYRIPVSEIDRVSLLNLEEVIENIIQKRESDGLRTC